MDDKKGVDKARDIIFGVAESIIIVAANTEGESQEKAYNLMPQSKRKAVLGLVLCRMRERISQIMNDELKRRGGLGLSDGLVEKLDSITADDLMALGKEMFGEEAMARAEAQEK